MPQSMKTVLIEDNNVRLVILDWKFWNCRFHSMSALVQHYKSFVIDRGNGKSEVFPVD